MKALGKSFTLCLAASVLILAGMLCIFPGAGVWSGLVALMSVWAFVFFSYTLLCPCNRGGCYTLLAIWTLMSAGVILNVWYFTTASGGTDTNPVLLNDDASTAWSQLNAVLVGSASGVDLARQGYGRFLALLCGGMQPHISYLLCTNMFATMLSIILIGATAARIVTPASDDRARARICTTAMILTGAVSYYISSGTILIKDAMCCLIMASVLYALYATGRAAPRWILLSLCAAVATTIRPNLLVFMALAAVIGLFVAPRRQIVPTVLLVCLFGALFLWQSYEGRAAAAVDTSDGTTNFWLGWDVTQGRLNAYSTVGGAYEDASNLRKVILLPFTLAVQFLTPLPWAFARDAVFGPAVAWAHFSFPWYIVGGILLYYLFFGLRTSAKAVRCAFGFGILAWVMTAFITGGTVSRYCLPWLPFLIPGAAWVVYSGAWRTRSFKIWMCTFATIIAIGLAIVFTALKIYSPDGWEVV